MVSDAEQPTGEPALRAIAMPADANPSGDIFGGWLLAQMDLAGGTIAAERAQGRVATVAIEGMVFHKPVHIGDRVSCYTQITRIGQTSIAVMVEAWRQAHHGGSPTKVTQGVFTYVAIDGNRRPRPVPKPLQT
jgi:acyl-CoA thioesterase YciA